MVEMELALTSSNEGSPEMGVSCPLNISLIYAFWVKNSLHREPFALGGAETVRYQF